MARESTQKKLSRVRAPRVHLTYDVEVGDAIEKKELPFVVGVLGDFSGNPSTPIKEYKSRQLTEIDRDNFDKVLEAQTPRVAFKVPNQLAKDDTQIGVDITFEKLDDFRPEAIVEKVEPLKKLVEVRTKLADLKSKMVSNDKLEELLQEVLSNTEKLGALGGEIRNEDAK